MRYVFFIVVLALTVFVSNDSHAQDLTLQQRILMPGQLIEGHADIESDCDSCHISFTREGLTDLCLDCHEDIANDRASSSGFHGQSELAAGSTCDTCHTDHEGRDADIVGLLPDTFNHSQTRFSLEASHQNVACENCHQPDEKFSVADSECVSCHLDQDVHDNVLGQECGTCHQETSWAQILPFDHDQTDFALLGMHEDVNCSGCHISQQFQFDDMSCAGCHQGADIHLGANGGDCGSCHQVSGWDQLTFNHNDTDFPLTGLHNDVACVACHSEGAELLAMNLEDQARQETSTDCNDCHAVDDVHLGRNGDDCGSCHLSDGWQQVQFDHLQDAGIALLGIHDDLECTNCHIGALDEPLSNQCVDCHIADDVHQDAGYQSCDNCHNTNNWETVSQFDHDFSLFPLLGLHRIVPCENCHLDARFAETDDQCNDCHGFEDVHEGSLGNGCDQCHTPNAWGIWDFDHSLQTAFTLVGRHDGLSCNSCHLPESEPQTTSSACIDCHRGQDVHAGGFGQQCGECHNTNDFSELDLLGRRPWE